jgi:hypothetical protein
MSFYGYNFTLRNAGGLGALIHDVLLAYLYSRQIDLPFGFVKEGYSIQRLNGSIVDVDTSDMYWHSYFKTFPIINQNECIETWSKYLPNTPFINTDISSFSDALINNIFILQDDILNIITKKVEETPFDASTDIVLHIRETPEKLLETTFIPIEKYVDECQYVLQKLQSEKNRIYICTDNQSVCPKIKNEFIKRNHNIEIVWDNKEPNEPIQELRWNSKLEKSRAQAETLNAFKNLFIMKNAKYLIGGRTSYFFRIAELLRYPKPTLNVKDNDKFGVAQYSEIPYCIRPYMKKTIPDFINNISEELLNQYSQKYKEEKIINVPNFISEKILTHIRKDIENYKWWIYATMPNNNIWKPEYNKLLTSERNNECQTNLINKNFAYRYQVCYGNHYKSCYCISCKLKDTISSFPVTDALCKIVGCRNLRAGEMFLSNYVKDDFLSLHEDKKKGDIAVTFSFSYDWYPCYGGILHFCDNENNIYKSIVPNLGSLTIFDLDNQKGKKHFVSNVNVEKNRYTLTAWYFFLE